MPRPRPARVPFAIAIVVAGTLDILFAITYWALKANVPAERILQSVAAGIHGKAAFAGGAQSAALGLALHFAIIAVMGLCYLAAAKRIAVLRERPVACGALYGLALYAAMNYAVVPLSAAMPASRDVTWQVLGVLAHVFLVGIPLALGTRRALA